MSVKVLDQQGRWRNKTVAFRISPEGYIVVMGNPSPFIMKFIISETGKTAGKFL